MKKFIIALMLLILAGMAWGSVSMAWQQAHMQQGQMNNPKMQQRSGNYQEFMQDSASIREQIGQDRAKLQTLQARENPDKNKVRELRNRIEKNINKLKEMADSHNVPMQNMQNRNRQMHRGNHGNGNYHMMGNCPVHNHGGYNQGRHGHGGCCW